jgi:hypothetical protein
MALNGMGAPSLLLLRDMENANIPYLTTLIQKAYGLYAILINGMEIYALSKATFG